MRIAVKLSLSIIFAILLVIIVMTITSRENTIAASQHITQRNQITKAQQIILTLSSDAISPEIGTEISFTLWLTNGSDSPLDHIVHTIVLTSEFPTPLLEEFPLARTLPFSLGTGQSIATPIDIRLVSTGAITLSAVTTFDMQPSVAVSIPGQVVATPITVTVPPTDVMAVVIYQALYRAGCYVDSVYPGSSPVVNVDASETSASCVVSADTTCIG